MNLIQEILNEHSKHSLLSLQNKTALVTGASSGIGLATAVLLAQEGCHLRLLARRGDRLKEIQDHFKKEFPNITVSIYEIDVNNSKKLIQLFEDKVFECDILINNAGLARGRSKVTELLDIDIDEMIDTNVKSMAKISRYCGRFMEQKKSGHMIHLGSIASHFAYENGSIYCATKYAVRAFTLSLRQEMHSCNVRVTLISPGMVSTEFSLVRFRHDETRAAQVYEGIEYLTATDIARSIVSALKEPTHVNLDEIIVMPTVQAPMTYKVHRKNTP